MCRNQLRRCKELCVRTGAGVSKARKDARSCQGIFKVWAVPPERWRDEIALEHWNTASASTREIPRASTLLAMLFNMVVPRNTHEKKDHEHVSGIVCRDQRLQHSLQDH
eukprot:2669997-Rhodomonas_salina.1